MNDYNIGDEIISQPSFYGTIESPLPLYQTYEQAPISSYYAYQYEEPLAYLPPVTAKVMIPAAEKINEFILVNPKQANRIQIMRAKRIKRLAIKHELGLSVDPSLAGSRYAMSRKKDRVRQKVANSRVRASGLFVNK